MLSLKAAILLSGIAAFFMTHTAMPDVSQECLFTGTTGRRHTDRPVGYGQRHHRNPQGARMMCYLIEKTGLRILHNAVYPPQSNLT